MPQKKPNTPKDATPELKSVSNRSEQLSERACRRIITHYRGHVEWIIRIPEWETLFAEGLVALDLPQPRRGINLRSLLDTMLLEQKFQLICWAFGNNKQRMPATTAQRLCELFSMELWKPGKLDQFLSRRQWEKFSDAFVLTLKKAHRTYKRAQSILFRRYQTILHKMVNRQVFDAEKRPDAYQEASIGLLRAIDKVDDTTASFGSYARTWISRHIRNYLMEQHFPVHVPINLASKILRQQSEAPDSERDPENRFNEDPLANLAKPGLSIEELTQGESQAPQQFPDNSRSLPSDSFVEKDMYTVLREYVERLTDKQREVLSFRYGLNGTDGGQTLACIAEAVGISHQQVSMREKRALQKLESALRPLYKEICD